MVFANKGIIASEKVSVGTRTSNLARKWRDDTPTVGYAATGGRKGRKIREPHQIDLTYLQRDGWIYVP